jgi:hypothetical protein
MGWQYLDLPLREGHQAAVRLASVYSFRKKVRQDFGIEVPCFKDDAEKTGTSYPSPFETFQESKFLSCKTLGCSVSFAW